MPWAAQEGLGSDTYVVLQHGFQMGWSSFKTTALCYVFSMSHISFRTYSSAVLCIPYRLHWLSARVESLQQAARTTCSGFWSTSLPFSDPGTSSAASHSFLPPSLCLAFSFTLATCHHLGWWSSAVLGLLDSAGAGCVQDREAPGLC